jgi:hypothetical protein
MQFTNLDRKLSNEEILNVESDLGISFPESLRDLFANHNGGQPEPYVFQEQGLHTVVNETLPLFSGEGRGTAVRTYQLLVIERQIVRKNFFPFAVDAGGDYFFADCNASNSPVYFYRSDVGVDRNRLLDLNLTLNEFWDCLQPEE